MTSFDQKQLASLFKSLGNPTRLKILLHLKETEKDSCIPTIISANLSMSLSSVSHNLSQMAETGVVLRRPTGRYVFYEVNERAMNVMKEVIE